MKGAAGQSKLIVLVSVHPETPGQIPRPARFPFGKEAFFVLARTVSRPAISGLPSAAPKGARKSMGCAEAYIGTASRSVEIGDRARLSLCGHRQRLWPSRRRGPAAPGRKRTLSGRKLLSVGYSNLCGTNGLRLLVTIVCDSRMPMPALLPPITQQPSIG